MHTKTNAFHESIFRLTTICCLVERVIQWWQGPEGSRSAQALRRCILLYSILLGSGFMTGCSSVIVPLAPGGTASMDSGQGLVFGHIHVTVNTKEQPSKILLPSDVQWFLSKKGEGKVIRIDALPIDGPFAFELPAGTYRLTDINLDVTLGVREAVLPATFTVQSGACTYVGSWELAIEENFFSGSIMRRVSDQLARDVDYLRKILGNKACPLLKVPLPAALDTASELIDRVQGTDLTSPP